ncbi:hypothetical protein KIPB_011895, partial [Kipferlia bialata]|eukprot:g11895.t1
MTINGKRESWLWRKPGEGPLGFDEPMFNILF